MTRGEQVRDLVLGHVDRRADQVARPLVGELDDVLAEVGLDRLDAVSLEVGVEADLLGDHALALGDRAGTRRAAQVEHDGAGLGGVAGPVDLAAALADLGLERLEVEVEVGQRVVLDRHRQVAEPLELGQALGGAGAAPDPAGLDLGQRLLQRRVGDRARGVAPELERGRVRGRAHVAGSPIAGVPRPPPSPRTAGVPRSPASTSATCRTCTGEPWRLSLPAMLSRQPRSPASTRAAPVRAMSAVLSATILVETSGYLTQKVPPKPQQTSGAAISASSRPRTLARRRRGWRFTLSSRRPEQESW